MTKTEELYSLFQQFPVVNTDSRKTIPDSLFFALKGENFDGNQFAIQALENGAAYAVVDDKSLPKDERLILVDNVLLSLQRLAALHRSKMKATVVAITGSNGKTTTKELCAAVLSKKYNTLYTQGNLNNHIGVPLTLLRMRPETEMAVIEMGANHMGEIRRLCQLAAPQYGLITNIGKAHLEGFGSFTGVINAKTELYTYLDDRQGKLFVNLDNPLLDSLSRNTIRFTYGKSTEADVYGELITLNPYIYLIWEHKGMQSSLQTNMIGAYNMENILAAIALGCFFGIGKEEIETAVQDFTPHDNRSQLIETSHNRIIADCYNANPVSMAEAIDNIEKICSNKPVYILGDMLELGAESEAEHAAILKKLTDLDAGQVFLVGREFGKVYQGDDWYWFARVDELIAHLKKNPLRKQEILVKASRGIQLEKLMDWL